MNSHETSTEECTHHYKTAVAVLKEKKLSVVRQLCKRGITPESMGQGEYTLFVYDLISLILDYQKQQVSADFATMQSVSHYPYGVMK